MHPVTMVISEALFTWKLEDRYSFLAYCNMVWQRIWSFFREILNNSTRGIAHLFAGAISSASAFIHKILQSLADQASQIWRRAAETIVAGCWLILKILGWIVAIAATTSFVLLAISLWIDHKKRSTDSLLPRSYPTSLHYNTFACHTSHTRVASVGPWRLFNAVRNFGRQITTRETIRDTQREQDAWRREQVARRQQEEARRQQEQARRQHEETRRQQEQARRQQDQARRQEAEARRNEETARRSATIEKPFEDWMNKSEALSKAITARATTILQPPLVSSQCHENRCNESRRRLNISFCEHSLAALIERYLKAKGTKKKALLDKMVRVWHPDRYMRHPDTVRLQAEEMTKILNGFRN